MRKLDWSEVKNAINQRKHKIAFEAAERFDWDTAEIQVDDREDYGELRLKATGFIGVILHVLIHTERDDTTWVISLRKATKKEREQYGRRAS